MQNSIIQQLRDPVFKGCTRPAMMLGVPLVPLVVVCAGCALLAMWGLLLSFWVAFAVIVLMVTLICLLRQVTLRDDQRLKQWEIRIWLRTRNRSSRHWGAVSYSAIQYKRR